MNWFESTATRWLVYIVFTVVSFIVALLATFPDGQVKEIAAVQIEHRLEQTMKTGYSVEVSDLDVWWIGVELQGLTIEQESASDSGSGGAETGSAVAGPAARKSKKKKSAKGKAAKKSKGGTPTKINVPSIGGRLAPIDSLFAGGLSVQYYLGLGGGSISGSFTRSSSAQTLTISVDDLNLAESPLLEQWTGIPIYGRIFGSGRFEMGGNRVLRDGSFNLKGKKVTVGPKPRLKVEALPVGYVSVPSVNLGNFELDTRVVNKDGNRAPRLHIDPFRAQGVDLRLEIWGKIKLGRSSGRANPLRARVQFDSDFVQENKSIKALQRHRKFQNGQRGKWYGLVFWGPLSGLNWKGSPTAAKGPSKTKGKPGPSQGG